MVACAKLRVFCDEHLTDVRTHAAGELERARRELLLDRGASHEDQVEGHLHICIV